MPPLKAALLNLLTRVAKLIQKHPGLVAAFGFASGLASFLLVERNESLAQVIAILMLLSWVWLILERWLRAGIIKRFGFKMPPAVMRFATQMVHQESLFFTLPFFLAATTWNHGQVLFTILLISCALISLIDPIYYNWLAPKRSLFVAFHALTLFSVLLVVNPLLLNLNTGQSLMLALFLALLFSLPSLKGVLPNHHWWRLPLISLVLVMMATGGWQVRSWIPPASLRLTDISLSPQMDREQRIPGQSIRHIDSASLHQEGLFAWTAVRAPRGLNERIHHLWLLNGEEVDRITLDIVGGREQGYRAWTHKLNFPAQAEGNWQVRVVTDSGQLIGLTRFTVETDSE